MQTLSIVVSVIAVLGFVGFKVLVGMRADTDARLKDAAIERQREAREAMEQALAKKAEDERQELNAKIDKITEAGDLGGALELLNRVRGTN